MGRDLEENQIIPFIRQKDYRYIKDVGKGGFGRAVLLKDPSIDEEFVCKKYEPYYPEMAEEFYKNFVKEIKLMYKLNHPNIVRIFNYYLYEEYSKGYILMEYINGLTIGEYLWNSPEKINEIFKQIITGFKYLENIGIMHRDIRPQNILVTNDGIVKIIDFGFGKKIETPIVDNHKSISLNWWCETPDEFFDNIYNIKTDIYFIGKLIEKIIVDNQITTFKYKNLLNKMTVKNPSERIKSFNKISQVLSNEVNDYIQFSSEERELYKIFANDLSWSVSEINRTSTYNSDVDNIIHKLNELYQNIMLEDTLPHNPKLINIFLNGEYIYGHHSISVKTIYDFYKVFTAFPKEKQNIMLNNLYSKLDGIKRYEDEDNEFPF